jgi:hypothetical protein
MPDIAPVTVAMFQTSRKGERPVVNSFRALIDVEKGTERQQSADSGGWCRS